MSEKINTIISKFNKAKVLVIGDLILDEFIWGEVNRISPEAPVPVVKVKSQSYMPGGAANVANNITAFGGKVYLAGIIGRDVNGGILMEELKKRAVNIEGIIEDTTRPTTLKTRIIAHSQQVVRIDRENSEHIYGHALDRIVNFVKNKIEEVDSVLIEDYGKGVITPIFLKKIIALAKRHKKYITVDPKEDHFSYYKHTTVITPNKYEAYAAAGIKDDTEEGLKKCGSILLKKLKCEAVLVTLGEKGMCLFEDNKDMMHIKTTAQNVYDVSGAGDTVIATLTLALSAGAKMRESAFLANCAAGIVVGKVGTAVCNTEELREKVKVVQKIETR
ncbi:MAG: D-glycero-beta-D-manno-heptose-7-phosphate kinase [Candidatus Omnitrophota bacterium]